MNKAKLIIYTFSWIAYSVYSFIFFPVYNTDVCFVALVLLAIGAWLYGPHKALFICLTLLIQNGFLYQYYGDILALYYLNALGTFLSLIIIFIVGNLKLLRDNAAEISVELDNKVEQRTNELQRLIDQLIADDEKLRRNLGQDIHDSLGQNLTGLALYCGSLKENLASCSSDEQACIVDLNFDAQRNLHLARKISRTLFPFSMTETGFASALDELTSYFSEAFNVDFKVRLDNYEQIFSRTEFLHLYRIIHEIILNALQHSTPSKVQINLSALDDVSKLSVEIDDYRGPVSISNSMFIHLMRYRASLIGAYLEVTITSLHTLVMNCTIPHSMTPPILISGLQKETDG